MIHIDLTFRDSNLKHRLVGLAGYGAPDMSTGRYITLEGAEGCGKSTHAARLADALDAVLTRETGGTAIGQRIRTILHDTTVTNRATSPIKG